jgi:hypothetical protein
VLSWQFALMAAINMVAFEMRTTVDIPDSLYRRLKPTESTQGCTVKELVLRGIKCELQGKKANRKQKLARLALVTFNRPLSKLSGDASCSSKASTVCLRLS